MCHQIPFNNLKPPQAIGEHVVKVPRFPMALNNTTDELFVLILLVTDMDTDSTKNWKTSYG